MEEEVKFCNNCKRDISVKNFVIHSAHCERKIQLCSRCSEPVPRTEFEKHEEEFHTQETCSDCNIAVEKWQIERHKETCTKKLVSCEYCELDVPLDNLSDHMGVCGCRTEQCLLCKKHVMIRDLKKHPTECLRGEIAVKKLLSCEYCDLEFSLDYLFEHKEACKSQAEQCPNCNKYIMRKDLKKHCTDCLKWVKEPEKVECEYCGIQIALNMFERHIATCGTRTERCPLCNQHVMVQERETHFLMCQKQLKLMFPCKYCKELFSQDCLEDHTLFCGFQTQKCEKCDRYIELKNVETHNNLCQESVSKTHGNCPVCRQSIPWIEMNVHSAMCAQMHYEIDEYDRQNQLNEDVLKKESETPADKRSKGKVPQLKKETKRCAYCLEIFPVSNFAEHLRDCMDRPYNCVNCLKSMPYRKKDEHFEYCHVQRNKRHYENAYMLPEEMDNKELKRLKKCPFCDEKLTDVLFHYHIKKCELQEKMSPNGARNISVKDMQKQQLQEFSSAHLVRDKTFTSVYSGATSNVKMNKDIPKNDGNMSDLEKNVEICPTCECKIPEERYSNHIKLCFEKKTQCKFCYTEIAKMSEFHHFRNCPKILEMTEQENNSQIGKKNTGLKTSGKSTKKWNPLGNFVSLFSNKDKSFEGKNTNESFRKYDSSQINRGHIYERGHMTPTQPPSTECNELPCEFCNEMWPFELIIEHQSGCRPDLVSFPKKESEDQIFAAAAASAISPTSVSNATSRGSQEDNNGWTIMQSRRNKQSSNEKSIDYHIRERNISQKPQLSTKENFFYYPSKDCGEVPKMDFGSSNKKRYPQLKESFEISKNEHTKLRRHPEISNYHHAKPKESPKVSEKQQTQTKKSPEHSKKCYPQSREISETLKKSSDKDLKEKDASSKIERADSEKNRFTSFKFSTSELNIGSQHNSNSGKENLDSSDAKMFDEMTKNYSYYQAAEHCAGLESVKSDLNEEKKAVGTERIRFMHSKKDFDEDISFVEKDCEELTRKKLNIDVSTNYAKMHDERKKKNSHYQAITQEYVRFNSDKSDFDEENKAVGAERAERRRLMHSKNDFDESITLVKKGYEELSVKKLVDVSTVNTKMHDEMMKNNAYNQATELSAGLHSVKFDVDEEKKAVGAERTDRMRFMHSKKHFGEDISFDENNKRYGLSKFLGTPESTALNLNMSAVLNTSFSSSSNETFNANLLETFSSHYDKDKVVNLSNADASVVHSILNSNIHQTYDDETNRETFGREFVESMNNNQNKEYENDTHSNSDDIFYDADDDDSKFIDAAKDNLCLSSTSPERMLSLYDFDNLNLSKFQRVNFSQRNHDDLNAGARPKCEDLNLKDSDLNACYQFLFKNKEQTGEALSLRTAKNCSKCHNKECSCEESSEMQKGSYKTYPFQDVSCSKSCSELIGVESFVETEASSAGKSIKSLSQTSNRNEVDESFAADEVLKWIKWRSSQPSDSE